MIKLDSLSKYFGKTRVLESVTMEIKDGESLAVIGPSGCGKSTLLRLLIRLEEPSAGKILVEGRDLAKVSADEILELRKKVGMVFQSSALFDSMNVYENVAFALKLHTRLANRQIGKIVTEKLRLVDLAGIEDLMPEELSGGMQKRVAIARALAFDPKIILYDEPTTGLDPITSVTIENLMLKLSQELKVTSIIVTHVMQTVYRVAKRIVMLEEGKFIESGTPEQTMKTTNPVIKKFISGGL